MPRCHRVVVLVPAAARADFRGGNEVALTASDSGIPAAFAESVLVHVEAPFANARAVLEVTRKLTWC